MQSSGSWKFLKQLHPYWRHRHWKKPWEKKIYAVGSTELGGANTAEALHAALVMGVPLLDADPAGRSVPELQHSTYYVKNVPIFPMGVATKFGEKIVIQNVQGDLRAEDIVRAIAVASDNMVGVADHAHMGKVIKQSLIPDMITYAQNIGKLLRETREGRRRHSIGNLRGQ